MSSRCKSWPEGISDGLVSDCMRCHRWPLFLDYTVTDAAWRKVVPEDMRRFVVCLPCFSILARDAGVELGEILERAQFMGATSTVMLIPRETYIWSDYEGSEEQIMGKIGRETGIPISELPMRVYEATRVLQDMLSDLEAEGYTASYVCMHCGNSKRVLRLEVPGLGFGRVERLGERFPSGAFKNVTMPEELWQTLEQKLNNG